MKTCQTFEDLQELGAGKIHERTHISRHKLDLLLNKSFGELNRLQVMGFISILEREYLLDLTSLREEYDAFVQIHPEVVQPKASVILQAASNTRKKWIIGSGVAIIVLIAMGIFMQGKLANFPEDEMIQLSTAEVEVPEENLTVVAETNSSEMNTTTVEQNTSNKPIHTISMDANTVMIKPIFNVWVGMIDINTSTKSEKVTKDPIILEGNKDILLVFGHGRLEVNTPQGSKTMRDKNMVYFAYENGILSPINAAEFKVKNNGNSW